MSATIDTTAASGVQLTNGFFNADGTFSFIDNGTDAPVRFYRLSTP